MKCGKNIIIEDEGQNLMNSGISGLDNVIGDNICNHDLILQNLSKEYVEKLNLFIEKIKNQNIPKEKIKTIGNSISDLVIEITNTTLNENLNDKKKSVNIKFINFKKNTYHFRNQQRHENNLQLYRHLLN